MRHHFSTLAALLTLLALPALPAQTVPSNHLIGWVDGALHIQDVDGACQPAKARHKVLGQASSFWAGGTAYDPRHESAWVSDGASIAEVRLSDGKVLCSFKAQLMDSMAVVSGLAIADQGRRLIQLETRAGYGAIRSYALGAVCPPTPLRDGCVLAIPQGHYSGGLAYDELEGLVYYTVTQPGFQVPFNWVHVADAKNRCKSLCSLRIGTCVHFFGTDVTGLAYDCCSKTLYATVGSGTVPIQVLDPRRCQFKVGSCCTKGSSGVYRGLAVVPGWSQFKKGTSCISKGCPFCNKLDTQLYGGAPSLGNPDFGVEVIHGPTGGLGIMGIAASTCGKGIGFSCGALWLPGGALIVVPGTLSGPQCGASLRVPLPVPHNANLCGASVCIQWVVGCAGGGGEGVTPAIQFTIAGS